MLRLRHASIPRLGRMAVALLIATAALLPVLPAGAQTPPGTVLVNSRGDLVERRDDGGFIARPVFDSPLAVLHYGLRDADTGTWLTGVYRVIDGDRALAHGWEYSFAYPDLAEHPSLDPEEAYLLVMLTAETLGDALQTHYAVVPVHQPDNLWDRVLAALNPERWARAVAAWIIQGVHGTLCGTVERAVGGDVQNCTGV